MKYENIYCDCNIIHKRVVEDVLSSMPDENVFESLSNLFKMLGDPTRAKIVWLLDKHEMCVCDIANVLNMTKSRVSHQLAILRDAGLISNRKSGKEVYYKLDDAHVGKLYKMAFKHVKHKIKVNGGFYAKI